MAIGPLPTVYHYPGAATLLNVTLHRDDDFRHWSIRVRDVGWDCRIICPTSVEGGGCPTHDAALAQKDKWEAQIDADRADGWFGVL